MEENQTRNTRKKWMLILLTTLVLLGLFAVGIIPRIARLKQIDQIAAAHSLPRVTVMEIKPNEKPIALTLPSSVQAWHYTPIWSRVNGYLLRYLVDIGDKVKSGDLLAEIDTPETDQLLAQAQADLANSIATRDIAKITSTRWQALWDKNPEAVTKQEVDQYNANLIASEALVVANEKNVARLKYEQQFKYIYAPFDGVITQRDIDIGSLIYGTINGIPQELFQLAQTHIMRFFVDVPQTYYTQIHDGLETEVTVLQLPGKVFKGKVARFANALDPTARTMLTQINVENEDGTLYPGLFGKVKFLLIPDTINFIIPTTAVIIRSEGPHVAVVDGNDTVRLKKVRIGLDYGNQMQIAYGLAPGDRIVVIPSERIREGVKVEVLK